MGILLDTTLRDPWEYLNGTAIKFGIDARNGNTILVAMYLFLRKGTLLVACVLVLASIIGMIVSGNAQERTANKNAVMQRLLVVFLIGAASGFLSFLMTVLGEIFGVNLG